MFRLNPDDFLLIGFLLEGFLYGVYSGVFAIYLKNCASKEETNKMNNIIVYSLCVLYVLSLALLVSDVSTLVFAYLHAPAISLLHVKFIQTTSFGCCDFIAQFILIYRCWIVWGRNAHVVVIPSILTFAFLATWLAGVGSQYISPDQISVPHWDHPILLSSISLSLTVNALVTALIVFRIFKVFREVKAASDDQILGVSGGRKLRRVIFILIESGMALFSIQLARLVITIVWNDTTLRAVPIIFTTHQMLTGIIPTIILVRTSMGLSFHDEKSMEEFAVESFRFTSSYPNLVPEMGSIGIFEQDKRDRHDDDDDDDDDIDGRRSNDDIEFADSVQTNIL